MSFLEDVRNQPRHIREMMFGLCVITTLSLVGMVWYRSFEKDMYALLNPGESMESRALASEESDSSSLFGNIFQAGKDLKAIFYNTLNLGQEDDIEIEKEVGTEKAYPLPISEEK